MSKRWTIEEKKFLKKNYGVIENRTIAKKMNRTKKAIVSMAIVLGFKYHFTKEHRLHMSEAGKGKPKKNGKSITAKGYIVLFCPNHPFAWKKGYIRRSRFIIEQWLRENEKNHPSLINRKGEKYLNLDWDVHHKNGIKDDDRIENLGVMPHGVHSKISFPKKINTKSTNKTANAYKYIKIPEHPFANHSGWVKQHRIVMENWLKENNTNHPSLMKGGNVVFLNKNWIVHHKNGIRDDNGIENLEVMTKSEHGKKLFMKGD